MKSDPNKVIAHSLSSIHEVLRGDYKTGSFVRDLGMSIDEFRVHIEKQFDSS